MLIMSKPFTLVILFLISAKAKASDISEIVFGDLTDLIPAAYGDFNSDELTDLFVLRDDFKTIDILLGSDDGALHLLHDTKNLKCHYPKLKITSVVPGDFDGDAFMDYIFTTNIDDGDKVGIFINWGGSDHINCTSNDTSPIVTMLGEPLAMDNNNDMVIDLFGMDEDGKRVYYIFEKGRGSPKKLEMEGNGKKLSVPHSHSFVDLNEDFAADLYLTTEEKSVEVWLSLDHKFVLNRTISYDPPGSKNKHYGQTIFMDMELNGNLNQLLPVCHDSECTNSTIWVQSGEHYHDLQINFFQDDNKTQWGFVTPGHEFFLICCH